MSVFVIIRHDGYGDSSICTIASSRYKAEKYISEMLELLAKGPDIITEEEYNSSGFDSGDYTSYVENCNMLHDEIRFSTYTIQEHLVI